MDGAGVEAEVVMDDDWTMAMRRIMNP